MKPGALPLLLALLSTAAAQETVRAPFDKADAEAVSTWLDEHMDELVAVYKHLHANPELSLRERKTAARLGRSLGGDGYQVTGGVGGTGVVAVLENGEGPTLLIRGDMDALPIVEQTGLPYASEVRLEADDGTEVGAMHACGHDVHTTMLVGAGKALAEMRDRWSGTLVLIGQPAEEVGKGARMMIADGLFERFPKPDLCLALHVKHDRPAGTVGYRAGWAAANVDSVDITIFGKGGHGAKPHSSVDPVVVAAHVITSLQTLVSRRVDPIEPAVVTVGSIHGGTKHNIIPGEVKLQLTVRSYTDAVRDTLLDGIRQITADTCRVFGCPKPPLVVVKDEYTPACYNHPGLTEAAARLFRQLLGEAKVHENPPTMGGEDFGTYARVLEALRRSRQPGRARDHLPLFRGAIPVGTPAHGRGAVRGGYAGDARALAPIIGTASPIWRLAGLRVSCALAGARRVRCAVAQKRTNFCALRLPVRPVSARPLPGQGRRRGS